MKAVALILMGVVLAGCGSGGTDRMVRTGEVETKTAAGRLTTTPPLLTLEDVAKLPAGSARQAVLRLLFFAQWGSLPSVVDGYDDRVVERIGVATLTGSYAWARGGLAASKPRIVSTTRAGSGTFVAMEFLTKENPPQRDSFLLRRVGGEWRVTYDTVLERAINGYIQTREATNPSRPEARAVRAGDTAAQRYREAFLNVRGGRRPAP